MVSPGFSYFKETGKARFRFWLLLFCFCIVTHGTECKSIASNIKDLKEALLKNYDRNLRPSVNQTPTDVDMHFEVQHIIEMDEKQQILTVKGHLTLLWADDRLKWKPEDYGDVRHLRFNKSEIWIPDIVLIFSLGESEIGTKSTIYTLYNGMLKWSPPMVFKAACGSKLRHYPFDEHNCTLEFGSWTYGRKISLQTLGLSTDSSNLPSASGWQVQNVEQKLNAENSYYVKVDVTIFLKRTSTIYKYVCVVPTLLTVMVTLAGFWLQASEPARYVLGCSNFIVMSLLLQHLVTTVPAGKEIPIIAEYSASCLCMSGVFILVTIIVNTVSRKTAPPPMQLVRFARNALSRWLCLTTFMQPAFSKKQAISTISDLQTNRMAYFDEQISLAGDWLLLSLVIDRIAFWIFTFIFVVLVGVLIGI